MRDNGQIAPTTKKLQDFHCTDGFVARRHKIKGPYVSRCNESRRLAPAPAPARCVIVIIIRSRQRRVIHGRNAVSEGFDTGTQASRQELWFRSLGSPPRARLDRARNCSLLLRDAATIHAQLAHQHGALCEQSCLRCGEAHHRNWRRSDDHRQRTHTATAAAAAATRWS